MSIQVKAVGSLTGIDGTGVVYELEENGVKTLAMIWADGKFHELSKADFLTHISQNKAKLTATLADSYQSMNLSNIVSAGYNRFFTESSTGETSGQTGSVNAKIELPFKIEGKVSLDLSQFKDLMSILLTD